MAQYTGWTIRAHCNEDGMGDTGEMDVAASMDAFEDAVAAALAEAFPGATIRTDRRQAMSAVSVSGPQGEDDDDLVAAAEDVVGRVFTDGAFWVEARNADTTQQKTCLRCGFTWRPRVDQPRECPACKHRRWWEAKLDKAPSHD